MDETLLRPVTGASEVAIIDALWDDLDSVGRTQGRPERLFWADKSRTALIALDLQSAFVKKGGPMENDRLDEAIPVINELAAACREAGIPVIWVRTVFAKPVEAGLMPLFVRDVAQELLGESSSTQLHPAVNRMPEDYEIVKRRYSAFSTGASGLDRLLRSLRRDTVIVVGGHTSSTLECTARDAMLVDYQVILSHDGSRNESGLLGDVMHEITLMKLKLLSADVIPAEALIAEVRAQITSDVAEDVEGR